MWKNKKVLVAGGKGFIGSNLTLRLLSLGAEVAITEHSSVKNMKLYYDTFISNQSEYDDKNFKIYQVDLLNKQHCEQVTKNQGIVFMCAAISHGAAFMQEDPMALVTSNIIMNAQMLDASYKNNIKKFVFISSSAAYPDTKDNYVKEEDMFIGDPYDKYFPVGWMKRYSEILCRTYAEKIKKPMQCIVLRPGNIFGEHDDYDFSTCHVVPALIRKVAEHMDPLEVWGTGDDVRDILYIGDFIDGMLLAFEKLEHYEPLNIASGQSYSVKEILKILCEIEDYKPHIYFNSDKPSMIPIRRIDISKAKELLSFEAKTNIKDALTKTLNWYKEKYPNGYRKDAV